MKQRQLLLFSLYSLIVIIAWVGFNLYSSSVTSTISERQKIQITPINPTLNEKIIDELKKREDIEPLYQLPGILSIIEEIPVPIIEESEATEEASLE